MPGDGALPVHLAPVDGTLLEFIKNLSILHPIYPESSYTTAPDRPMRTPGRRHCPFRELIRTPGARLPARLHICNCEQYGGKETPHYFHQPQIPEHNLHLTTSFSSSLGRLEVKLASGVQSDLHARPLRTLSEAGLGFSAAV